MTVVGFAESPEYLNYSGIYIASPNESTVNGKLVCSMKL